MIAIAMEPPTETAGVAQKATLADVSTVGPIAELGGGDSTLKNVPMGGAVKQRIKRAAAEKKYAPKT
jgi:hypothetical protein